MCDRPLSRTLFAIVLPLLLTAPAAAQKSAPWSTFRGNPQRTGNTDGLSGPTAAKVLWVHKSRDHHLSSPVVVGDRLYLAGLTGFNVGYMSCFNTQPKPKDRVLWSKSTPLLRLPTVSSPALIDGRIVFGDGMHQTSGATLYCLDGGLGLPLWQHNVPGELVHLESSPTIVDELAYIGGGNAGVFCVEANRASLGGKTLDLPGLKKAVEAGWADLQAKYQKDRKKDPDTPPPNESQYLHPDPKHLWQEGKDKWHVDAPLAVVGGKVVAASTYLDMEKTGDRALICLDAKNGKMLWRTPLKLNPWGGPAISGDTIVISGSTIGYYPQQIKGAKGFVAAYNLADGKQKWYKPITGGITSCAAIADGAAIVTATDGKVRAFELTDGSRRWIYEAKATLFAPPAIAGNVVYAGDLRGVVHAIALNGPKQGEELWKLDIAANPATQSPGMFYGGPVVQAGRLYIASCNLEGEHARKDTVIVCIGEK
jgi:outer membrane protein assembly factor BamB